MDRYVNEMAETHKRVTKVSKYLVRGYVSQQEAEAEFLKILAEFRSSIVKEEV